MKKNSFVILGKSILKCYNSFAVDSLVNLYSTKFANTTTTTILMKNIYIRFDATLEKYPV